MSAWVLCALLPVSCFSAAIGQKPAPTKSVAPVDRNAAGDSPDNPGPLAKNLSAAIKPKAISAAMKKVADWELTVAKPSFNQQWTFAALYDGLLAASATTRDQKYRDAVLHMAEHFNWQLLDHRFPHTDDQALGQAYLDLYQQDHQPEPMADTKAIMDRLVVRPDDPNKLLWWWCDALFMSPPVLARTYAITHDRKYLDYMDHEWSLTSASLYDKTLCLCPGLVIHSSGCRMGKFRMTSGTFGSGFRVFHSAM